MSDVIDRNIVEMQFNNAQFEAGVKTSMNTIDKLKKSLNFDSVSKSFDNINASAKNVDLSPMSKAVESVRVQFSALDIISATVISRLTNTVINAGKKLANSTIGQIMSGGWNRATNIDQAKFSLEGLKIAWEQAYPAINFAVSQTAYGLDAAAKAAASLAASNVSLTKTVGKSNEMFEDGTEELTEMAMALRAISGVAAQTNSSYEEIAPIFTRVAGNGRMMAMELNMLSSKGLNAAAVLGEALGKSESEIREMTRKGQIDFQTFSEAMYDAFGEHAVKANETFEGALANMKAAMSKIGAEFATPIREGLIGPFNSLRLMFNEIKKNIKPLYEAFGPFFKIATSGIVNFIDRFTASIKDSPLLSKFSELGGLKDIGMTIYNVFNALYRILMPIGKAFREIFPPATAETLKEIVSRIREFTENIMISEGAMNGIRNIFKGLFTILKIVIKIIDGLLKVISPVIKVATQVLSVILSIIGAIGDFIDSMIDLDKYTKSFDGVLQGISKALTTIAAIIIYVISKLVEFGKGIYDVVTNSETLKTVFIGIGVTLKTLAATIGGVIVLFGQLISKVGPGLKKLFNEGPSSILASAGKHLDNIKNALVIVRNEIVKILKQIQGSSALNYLKNFAQIIKKTFVNLLNLIQTSLNNIGNVFDKLVGNIKNFISSFGQTKQVANNLEEVADAAKEVEKHTGGNVNNRKMYASQTADIKSAKSRAALMSELALESKKANGNVEGVNEALHQMSKQLQTVSSDTNIKKINTDTVSTNESLKKSKTILDRIKDALNAIKNTKVFQALGSAGKFIGEKLGAALGFVKDKLVAITDTIKNFVKSIDFGRLLTIAFATVIMIVGISLSKLANSISSVTISLTGMFNTISRVINTFSMVSTKSRSSILDVAMSIAVVAGALLVLSKVFKEGALTAENAMKYLTKIMIGLGALELLMLAVVKTGMGKDATERLQNVSLTMISVAGSIVLLSYALKNLQNVNFKSAWDTISVMSVLITEMVGVAYVLTKIGSKDKLHSPTLSLLAFAFAVDKLVKALEDTMALTYDKDRLNQAIMGITAMLLGLSVVATAAKGVSLTGIAGLLLAVAAVKYAVPLLGQLFDQMNKLNQNGATTLTDFGKLLMNFSDILLKMAAITAGIVVIGSVFGKNLLSFGVGLMLYGFTIDKMVECLKKTNDLNLDAFGDAMDVIKTFFEIFILVEYFSKYTENSHMIAFSISLYMMIGCVGLLIQLTKELAKLPDDALDKMETASALVKEYLVLLGIMSGFAGLGTGSFKNLLAITSALFEVFTFLLILTSDMVDQSKLAAAGQVIEELLYAVTSIFGALSIISVFSKDENEVKQLKGVIEDIIGLTTITFAALAGITYYIPNIADLKTVTDSFFVALSSLALIFYTIGRMNPKNIGDKAKVIHEAVVGVTAIMTALAALTMFDNEYIHIDAWKLSTVAIAISGIMIVFGDMLSKVSSSLGKVKPEMFANKADALHEMLEGLSMVLAAFAATSVWGDPAKIVLTGLAICGILKILNDVISDLITIRVFNGLDTKVELIKNLTIPLIGLMGTLALISTVGAFKDNTKSLIVSIGAISLALYAYGKLIKTISEIKPTHDAGRRLEKQMKASAFVIAALGGSLAAIGAFGNPTSIIAGAAGLSACIIAYSKSLEIISKTVSKNKNLEQSIKTLTAGILAMSVLSAALNLIPVNNNLAVGVTLFGIGSAMAGYGYALDRICEIVDKHGDNIAKSTMILLTGLAGISVVVGTLSTIATTNADWKSLTAIFAGISGIMLAFSKALTIMNDLTNVINDGGEIFKILAGMAVAVYGMGVAFGMIGDISWDQMLTSVLGISGVLAAFTGMLYVISTKDLIKDGTLKDMMFFLIEIAGSLAVLGTILYALSTNNDWNNIITPLLAMGGAMYAFTKVMDYVSGMQNVGDTLIKSLGFMGSLAISIAALAGAFSLLTLVPWDKLQNAAGPMIITLTALTALGMFASKMGDKMAIGLVALAAAMFVLAGALAALGGALGAIGDSFDVIAEAFSVLHNAEIGQIAYDIANVINVLNGLNTVNYGSINKNMRELASNMMAMGRVAGMDWARGLIAGLTDGSYVGMAQDAMEQSTTAIIDTFRKVTGWHSPWLTMIAAGQDGVMGLVLGWLSKTHYGEQAIASSTEEMMDVAMEDVTPEVEEKGEEAGEAFVNAASNGINQNGSKVEAATAETMGDAGTVAVASAEYNGKLAANATGETLVEGWNKLKGPLGTFVSRMGDALGKLLVQGIGNGLAWGFDQLAGNYAEMFEYFGWFGTTKDDVQRWRDMADENMQAALQGFGDGIDDALTAFDDFSKEIDLDSIIEKITGGGGLKDAFGDLFNWDTSESESVLDAAGALDGFSESAENATGSVSKLSESLYKSIDTFGEFNKKTDLSAAKVLRNMKSQVEGMTNWATNLASLRGRISETLFQELVEKGISGYEVVAAMAKMSDAELSYASSLKEQQAQAALTSAALLTDKISDETAKVQKAQEDANKKSVQATEKANQQKIESSNKYTQAEIDNAKKIIEEYKKQNPSGYDTYKSEKAKELSKQHKEEEKRIQQQKDDIKHYQQLKALYEQEIQNAKDSSKQLISNKNIISAQRKNNEGYHDPLLDPFDYYNYKQNESYIDDLRSNNNELSKVYEQSTNNIVKYRNEMKDLENKYGKNFLSLNPDSYGNTAIKPGTSSDPLSANKILYDEYQKALKIVDESQKQNTTTVKTHTQSVSSNTGAVKQNTEAVNQNVVATQQVAQVQKVTAEQLYASASASDLYVKEVTETGESYKNIIELTKDLADASETYVRVLDAEGEKYVLITDLAEQMGTSVEDLTKSLPAEERYVKVLTETGEEYKNLASMAKSLTKAKDVYIKSLDGEIAKYTSLTDLADQMNKSTSENMSKNLKTISKSFSEYSHALMVANENQEVGKEQVIALAAEFMKANPKIASLGFTLEDITTAMMDMSLEMSEVKDNIKKMVDDSIDIFAEWDDEYEMTSEKILKNMHSQIRGITKWSGQLESLAARGIDASLLSYLQSLGPKGAEYVNAFAQMTNEELQDANETYVHAMNIGSEVSDQLVKSYSDAGYFLSEGFAEGILNGTGKSDQSAEDLGDSALKRLMKVLDEHSPSVETFKIGANYTIGFANGILDPNAMAVVTKAINTVGNTTLSNMRTSNIKDKFTQIGKDLLNGLANGISSNVNSAVSAISGASNSIINAARRVLDVHSPSRIFEAIGMHVVEGLKIGIEEYSKLAYDSASNLADDTMNGFNNGYNGISSIIDWDDLNPVITPSLDLTNVIDGVKKINTMMGGSDSVITPNVDTRNQNGTNGGMTFIQNNTSPKALDRIEIYRQTKNLISSARGAMV